MSSIYKITNLINNKIYIGYTSRTLQRRFYEHVWSAMHYENDTNYFHRAIRKYGKENFQIEEIYSFNEDEEDWKTLEQTYIKEYNSLSPNGYNTSIGGEIPVLYYGEDNIKCKVSNQDMEKIYQMLQDNTIPYSKIAKEFNVTEGYLYKINRGKARIKEGLIYPLREYDIYEERALKIIELLQTNITLSNTEIGKMFNFRPNEIASINNGKKFGYLYDGDFPIRKITVPNDLAEKQKKRERILNYIFEKKKKNESYTQIGIQRDLGYSRMIVEKTLKNVYPYCDLKNYKTINPVETIPG